MGGSIPIQITVASSAAFMTGITEDVQRRIPNENGGFPQSLIEEHSEVVRKYGGSGRRDDYLGGRNWISILRLYDSYNDVYGEFQRAMNTHLSKLLAFERKLRHSSRYIGFEATSRATDKLRNSEKQLMDQINHKIVRKIRNLELSVTYHRIALSKIFENFTAPSSPSDQSNSVIELSPNEIIFLASHIEPITCTISQHLQFLRREARIMCHSLMENKIKRFSEIEQGTLDTRISTENESEQEENEGEGQGHKSSSSLSSSEFSSSGSMTDESFDDSDEENQILYNLIVNHPR